jgi:hypothetical protein
MILKRQILLVVPHIGLKVVGTTFGGVELRHNIVQVIYNHYLTAVFRNKEDAFQIHIFRDFAVVFDGECYIFFRFTTYTHMKFLVNLLKMLQDSGD